jgi:hypothetical protein
MVPSAYVFLDAFPLTPNRKIDRNALPAPDLARPELANEYTPPRNALETVLTDIMSAVLDLDQVGVHDDFFELGGHSLQATRFVARAGKALRSEIPLWTFLRSPNVAEFATELAEQEDAARLLRVAELRVRMAQMSPEEIEQLLAQRQGADS